MSFGAVIGGALQGIGAGIVKTGEDKAATAAADVAYRRQLALQQFQSGLRKDEATQQGQITQANTEAQYDLMDRNAARDDLREVPKQVAIGHAKVGDQIQIDTAKTRNDIMLEGVRHQYKMTEQQAAALQSRIEKQTLAGIEVGETRVAKNGAMVLYAKNGTVIDQGTPGEFIPDGTKARDEGGSFADRYGGGETAPAAAPAPKPAAAAKTPAATTQAPVKAYTMAEAKATAAARGIPLSEVHKVMRANGYKLTGN